MKECKRATVEPRYNRHVPADAVVDKPRWLCDMHGYTWHRNDDDDDDDADGTPAGLARWSVE